MQEAERKVTAAEVAALKMRFETGERPKLEVVREERFEKPAAEKKRNGRLAPDDSRLQKVFDAARALLRVRSDNRIAVESFTVVFKKALAVFAASELRQVGTSFQHFVLCSRDKEEMEARLALLSLVVDGDFFKKIAPRLRVLHKILLKTDDRRIYCSDERSSRAAVDVALKQGLAEEYLELQACIPTSWRV